MNLKGLIKEVESVSKNHKSLCKKKMYGDTGLTELECLELQSFDGQLRGIKQTVEAIDEYMFKMTDFLEQEEDWQKLKKLLDIK